MHRAHPSMRTAATFFSLVMTVFGTPALAHASPPVAKTRTARSPQPRTCTKAPVEIVAGSESSTFSLARCDGTALPAGIDELSVLARPGAAARPEEPIAVLSKHHGQELAPGIRRVDSRLVERLQLAADHFRKDAQLRMIVVSGYRPKNSGSFHGSGKAIDFRIDGVSNEALANFCKTLPDTGCGFYPNGVFVHMDARERGTGHVAWVDANPQGGDAPRVTSLSPAAEKAPSEADGENAKLPVLPAGPNRVSTALPAASMDAPIATPVRRRSRRHFL